MLDGLNELIKNVDFNLEKYRFADAGEAIYHFMWDQLASFYIEQVKNRDDKKVALSVLRHMFLTSLKLLHPFMPFITEAVWDEMKIIGGSDELLVGANWPKVKE